MNKLFRISLVSRRYSTKNPIEKTVIISESNDIYTNLALEDWYYKNWNPNKHMLILWSNNPCVVIGKFQNPWLEANVSELGHLIPGGVKLARRNSGGGTVYHDRGNLNLTFFTPREHYNRKHNLEIITKAISKEYGLNIDITKRDDLVVGDRKVSGTAAKLARTVAYHHCTLLVNSDKKTLKNSLKKPQYDIETNATRSTSSKTINLTDIDKNITVADLMVYIGKEYLITTPEYFRKTTTEANDTDRDVTSNDTEIIKTGIYKDIIENFHILRPNEEEFPGLIEIRDSLNSWEWIFGKCPKFTATKSFPCATEREGNDGCQTRIIFDIDNGRINDGKVQLTQDASHKNLGIDLDDFKNRKFTEELFEEVFHLACGQLKVKNQTKIM